MIAFDLNCSNGHQFEGWFSSSADFDRQISTGIVSCPLCADIQIRKALSVPNVPRKGNQQAINLPALATQLPDVPANPIVAAEPPPPALVELMHKLARAQTEMLDNSQWVGGNFAETARAIHYGEEPGRLIHGETSTDEAKALVDEGISVAPLLFPVIPPTAKN